MSTDNTPRDEADLEEFLARKSPISTAYDQLELVEPPEALEAEVLVAARAAIVGSKAVATKPAPQKPGVTSATPGAAAIPLPSITTATEGERSTPARARIARGQDQDDGDDELARPRRPRWLVPAALAASALVAVGIGVLMLGNEPFDLDEQGTLGSMFAKRARERREAEKSAEAAAGQDAGTVMSEAESLPPPPPAPSIFEAEGPQVEDLPAAIALIRKELVLANQIASLQAEGDSVSGQRALDPALAPGSAAPSGSVADLSPATSGAGQGEIQPRERRLTKILELYDGGHADLASDSLEIFLRDFEDDPVSQRILGIKP